MAAYTITVDGVRIRYRILGEGEPLLLLHGYPQSRACWRYQVSELAKTHRVIVPDWFGWGESERSFALKPEYNAEVERIGRLADALGLERFNLAGHDYGGFLGLGYVTHHQARVLRFAILNSRAHRTFTSTGFYWQSVLQGIAARTPLLRRLFARLPLYEMHRKVLGRYLPKAFGTGNLHDYLSWMQTAEGRRWLVHFFRYYEVAPRPELDAGLESLQLPTAVIWGDRDPYCGPDIGRDLAARIPNATLTILPGADHYVMEERPAEVLAELQNWLQRRLQDGRR